MHVILKTEPKRSSGRSNRRGATFALWMGAAAIDVGRFFHRFALGAAILFAGDHARAIGMSALLRFGHEFLQMNRCDAAHESDAGAVWEFEREGKSRARRFPSLLN